MSLILAASVAFSGCIVLQTSLQTVIKISRRKWGKKKLEKWYRYAHTMARKHPINWAIEIGNRSLAWKKIDAGDWDMPNILPIVSQRYWNYTCCHHVVPLSSLWRCLVNRHVAKLQYFTKAAADGTTFRCLPLTNNPTRTDIEWSFCVNDGICTSNPVVATQFTSPFIEFRYL